ncbi:annexin A4-like [Styela clava]
MTSWRSGKRGRCTMMKNDDFNVREETQSIWRAIHGLGTDEEAIIQIVSSCNNAQRQEIKKEFTVLYQKDLIKEFKSELKIRFSPDFKQLLLALFQRPLVYDAVSLKGATKGLGTDERCLVEILLTRTAAEMQGIREEYSRKFKLSLEDDVADDTSGDFRKFTYTLSRGKRSPSSSVDADKARHVASQIYSTYTELRGTDQPRFDFIGLCCCEGFPQLRKIFEAYKEVTKSDINAFIEREFSGDVEEGLKWTVKCANSIPEFFAELLHKSMEGITTKHDILTRIVVSRSEIDLADIREIYEKKYGKSLINKVKSHATGGYKKLLVAIIQGNGEKDNQQITH